MLRSRALLLALMLGAGNAAFAGLFSDDEAHQKITELQQKVQAYEARLAGLEASMRKQSMDGVSQLDTLKAELGTLRGQLEVQAHEVETTQKRQRDLYVDLDGRLRALERAAPAPAAEGAAGTPPAAGGAPADAAAAGKSGDMPLKVTSQINLPSASAGPAEEGRNYDNAFNLFKAGNYQGAIAGFQGFIQSYPNSPLAGSAQYWIGNSHFNLRDFKSAVAAQQALLAKYPKSSKVPDALLNIASSQQNMNEASAARKTLEELVAKYPLSEAADKAKKRLAQMK